MVLPGHPEPDGTQAVNQASFLLAGFDAGQTTCRCRLSRWNGERLQVLGEGRGSGVSHLDAHDGEARFRRAIDSSLEAALEQVRDGSRQQPLGRELLHAAAIGASGIEADTDLQTRGAALLASALTLPEHRCLATGDERTALRGAFPDRAGIVLISGTGMIVVGRDATGREHRCGGWGWRLDGAGSAFDIGHQALQLSVRMADGRVPDSPLRHSLWTALGCRSAAELKALVVRDHHAVADEARLAPLVADAAAGGDPAARRILQRSASALADAAAATAHALDLQAPCLEARGGALEHMPLFRQLVQTSLGEQLPDSHWQTTDGDACHGALVFALELAGLRPH